MVAAAANDPGERGGSRAAEWLLAPPSCGDQPPARVPRAAPRRSSLRLPLSLPGSFALARYAAALPPLPPRGSFALEHALHRLFRLFGSSTSPSSTLWQTFLHDAQMK